MYERAADGRFFIREKVTSAYRPGHAQKTMVRRHKVLREGPLMVQNQTRTQRQGARGLVRSLQQEK